MSCAETEPLLISSAGGEKTREPSLKLIKDASVQFVDPSCKLESPLKTKEDRSNGDGDSDWLGSATAAVVYYAIAASFGSILSGCTLAFPSSAVLDLTDSEPRREYKFDSRLSDVFGVSPKTVTFY